MRKSVLFFLLLLYAFIGYAQSPSDILAYISKYKQVALEQEKRYGIPASITLAQGILESGAGTSMLTRNANNHFGIKAGTSWNGSIVLAWDDETQKSKFRKYNSHIESFEDHAKVLKSNRYRSLFTKSIYDYRAWAIGLQSAGYATASNYAKALIGYIDAYKLYAINGGVKLKPGKTITITKYITKEQPIFDNDCQMAEDIESEEELSIREITRKFVVEINDVRCTLLHPGESLSSISMRYDIPKKKILEYNEIDNESGVTEGDIVYLEKKRNKYMGATEYYRVKEDDSLYGISQKFGIRLASLAKMNDINIFTKLTQGERLRLK